MSVYSRWTRVFLSAFWFALTAAVWIAFAPTQAFGQAAYVVIIGASMEPNFRIGDLVVVHESAEYKVGDIVAYKNADLNANVFHRIIAIEQDRFILQGDNNDWVDSTHPARADIIGKLWIHLPRAGTVLQRIRQPIVLSLLAGAFAGIILFHFLNLKPKGGRMNKKTLRVSIHDLIKRRKRTDSAPPSDPRVDSVKMDSPRLKVNPSPFKPWTFLEPLAFALALIAFASFILAVISFTRRASISAPDYASYQHVGLFSYSATAPAGVYDSNLIQSGDPIFPNLTCNVKLNFNYTLAGVQMENIAGAYQAQAKIVEPQSGWTRTLILKEETPFTGNTFGADIQLDLCQVIALIERMESQTEYYPNQYLVSATVEIQIHGKVAGRDINDSIAPQIDFRYDRLAFFVVRDDPKVNPFVVSIPKSLASVKDKPNVFSFLWMEIPIGPLRIYSVVGFVLALMALWRLTSFLSKIQRDDPPAYARMKHNALILDVQNLDSFEALNPLDVASLDDLAKLAEKYNAMILHEPRGETDVYIVHADIIYRLKSERNRQNE